MVTVVYALGLYVAADSLGWPSAARVTAAFDRDAGLASRFRCRTCQRRCWNGFEPLARCCAATPTYLIAS